MKYHKDTFEQRHPAAAINGYRHATNATNAYAHVKKRLEREGHDVLVLRPAVCKNGNKLRGFVELAIR